MTDNKPPESQEKNISNNQNQTNKDNQANKQNQNNDQNSSNNPILLLPPPTQATIAFGSFLSCFNI